MSDNVVGIRENITPQFKVNDEAVALVETLSANVKSGIVTTVGIVAVHCDGTVTNSFSNIAGQWHALHSGLHSLAKRFGDTA